MSVRRPWSRRCSPSRSLGAASASRSDAEPVRRARRPRTAEPRSRGGDRARAAIADAGAESSPRPSRRSAAPSRAPTLAPSGPLLHGTLELSLQDAIRMGLENNLDVAGRALCADDRRARRRRRRGARTIPSCSRRSIYTRLARRRTASRSRESDDERHALDRGIRRLRGILPIAGTEYYGQFDGAAHDHQLGRRGALAPLRLGLVDRRHAAGAARSDLERAVDAGAEQPRLLHGSSQDELPPRGDGHGAADRGRLLGR